VIVNDKKPGHLLQQVPGAVPTNEEKNMTSVSRSTRIVHVRSTLTHHSAASTARRLATTTRRSGDVPLPPVECFPWCVDGDGHPDQLFTSDQACTTEEHNTAALLIPRMYPGGDPEYVSVYGTASAIGCEEATVRIGRSGLADMTLTPTEARKVAKALRHVADVVEGKPGAARRPGSDLKGTRQ